MLKILNLYAGIGGNRKLWPNDQIEVIAVEINPKIAKIYQDFFPNDKVIIGDAHEYLLDHYKEFDFIWSSPPCPTHSNTNFYLNAQGVIRYPDMSLWQEIIFLSNFYKGLYCVENVIPYYEPFIEPQYSGRHCFWSNFNITNKEQKPNFNTLNARESTRNGLMDYEKNLEDFHEINIREKDTRGLDRRKLLRNCVNPRLGLHIFNCAFKIKQKTILEVLE